MIGTMPDKRPKKPAVQPEPQEQAQPQAQEEEVIKSGHRFAWSPADDVLSAYLDFRSKLEFKPDHGDIIDRAMRLFFKSKGYAIADEAPPKKRKKRVAGKSDADD